MPVLLSVWVILLGAPGAGDGKLLSMSQWALPRHKGLLQLEQLLGKDPWREEPLGMSHVQLNHPGSTGAVEGTSLPHLLSSQQFLFTFSCLPLTFPSSFPSFSLSWEHSLQQLNHTTKICFPRRVVVANIDLAPAADSGIWLKI